MIGVHQQSRQPDICPSCGQPIPPTGLRLPPLKAKLFEIVRKHPGISSEELRTRLWADDPAGGQEDRKVLHVHINQTNHRLAPHGLRIRFRGGYRICSVGDVA